MSIISDGIAAETVLLSVWICAVCAVTSTVVPTSANVILTSTRAVSAVASLTPVCRYSAKPGTFTSTVYVPADKYGNVYCPVAVVFVVLVTAVA